MASLGGTLNFLNNGTAPLNVNSSQTSSNVLPQWYQDYTQSMLQRASQYANQNAPLFPGQQVAGLTPQQEQSYQTVGNTASQYANTVPGAINTVNSANPYAGLSAASPFLGQADQTSASNVNQYMNPYIGDVAQGIETLGMRNLNENLLPGMESAFTSAGGGGHYGADGQPFGNSQEGTYEERLARDTGQNIGIQESGALMSGYGQALSTSAADLARQGTLGQTAGGLGNLGAANQMTQGVYTGNLANTGVGVGNQIAGALNTAGTQQQQQGQQNINAAMNNYYQQFQWPATGLGTMEGALNFQVPSSNVGQYNGPLPGAGYGNSPLQTLGGLSSSGALSNLGNYVGTAYNALSGLWS